MRGYEENGCGDTKDTGANSDGCRTLVYVEGDASMRKYESREGKTENALSIVQRLFPTTILPDLNAQLADLFLPRTEKLEILKRPEQQSSGEEQMQQE